MFIGVVLTLCLSLSLALPHRELTPMIAAVLPAIAVALTILIAGRTGSRRGERATIGFRRPTVPSLLIAVGLPIAIASLSFGVAAATGVVRLNTSTYDGSSVADIGLKAIVLTALFLAEEVGWRGYLLPRLADLMSRRWAAVATGAAHAAFHLPLLLITTTYQSAGIRWIVVPTVLLTITAAGIPYAWLRWSSCSIWPVAVMHATFNEAMGRWSTIATAESPAAMVYTTTETGLVTLALMIMLGAGLLSHARVMKPPRCHEDGTTWSEHRWPLGGSMLARRSGRARRR